MDGMLKLDHTRKITGTVFIEFAYNLHFEFFMYDDDDFYTLLSLFLSN